jgi:uncharacterized protein
LPLSLAPPESPLAPRWHTAALIALVVSVAVVGALLTGQPGAQAPTTAGSRLLGVYAPLVIVQWSLVFYVCRVGRSRSALPALLGARWSTPGRAFADLSLALAGWLILLGSELAWAHFSAARAPAAVVAMLPHTPLERLAWVVVAASAGFGEEVVYRGYLQTQLTAFTGRAGLAIALQALLFGLAHGEQGASTAARFAVYGLAFGALARWRRSLLPGIVCHVWTDIASGLLRP